MSIDYKPVCPHCGFDDCESQTFESSTSTATLPPPSISGASVDAQAAVDAAKRLLSDAIAPLVCGLNCLDSQTQFAAWKLSDRLRATVDTTLTNRNRAAVQTFQRYGKVTATYGEIRNRSDLVVLWDCDLKSHAACLANLIGNSKVDRTVVFIGSKDSPGATNADVVIELSGSPARNQFVTLACLLRAKIAGVECNSGAHSGASQLRGEADRLFGLLTECDYGCMFFKQHSADSEFDLETESLMLLVRELNSKTRFVGTKLRDDLNGLGAETVLTLASGFPQAVNLSRSSAAHAGLNFSAQTMLTRSAADVVLFFGDAKTHDLSAEIIGTLKAATVIQIGPTPASFADVFIPAQTLDRARKATGTVFRGDGAMLRGSEESSRIQSVEVLEMLG